ncbi:hypothetical protein P280DRAFT_213753 [Massarina eburnea CBS 473.64]|uniref:Uncharacterized protein n=1 Tax=Massarina eburnea CBS 473.64 TaxID=1395130 RepID=A0A6A6SB45_9PLEO|nr:hypothetical protein P280DRAFT_213753 [Massarina eburnea CBS 473.64]
MGDAMLACSLLLFSSSPCLLGLHCRQHEEAETRREIGERVLPKSGPPEWKERVVWCSRDDLSVVGMERSGFWMRAVGRSMHGMTAADLHTQRRANFSLGGSGLGYLQGKSGIFFKSSLPSPLRVRRAFLRHVQGLREEADCIRQQTPPVFESDLQANSSTLRPVSHYEPISVYTHDE